MYELFELFLDELVNWSILAFELVGVIILLVAGILGIKDYIQKSPTVRLALAEGMALALEFKLGSEILRTVIVRDISELYFIAGIIILRASLTFLIHWEIDYEEKAEARKNGTIALYDEDEVSKNPITSNPIVNARFGHKNDELRNKAKEKYSKKE